MVLLLADKNIIWRWKSKSFVANDQKWWYFPGNDNKFELEIYYFLVQLL